MPEWAIVALCFGGILLLATTTTLAGEARASTRESWPAWGRWAYWPLYAWGKFWLMPTAEELERREERWQQEEAEKQRRAELPELQLESSVRQLTAVQQVERELTAIRRELVVVRAQLESLPILLDQMLERRR